MKHYTHSDKTGNQFKVALLVKDSSLKKSAMDTNYVLPLKVEGVVPEDIISFGLAYNSNNKAPVKLAKDYLGNLLKALNSLGVTTIYCADAGYFKVLTKQKKAEPHFGYVLPCMIDKYQHMNVVLGVNHSSLFYNPNNQSNLDLSLKTLSSHLNGSFIKLGEGIIHSESYPETIQEISDALDSLHQYDALTCDIEAFSLKHYSAGIGTIAFAWDENNGMAFCCDWTELTEKNEYGYYGTQYHNPQVRALLLKFFCNYKGKLTYHNQCYDVKVLIFQLYMSTITDHVGLLRGLEVMTRDVEDTKVIAYLATNSCAGNKLSLKDIAHEFAGNYAQDEIKDIRKIPKEELLRYNLIDCLATWYAYKKNKPIMVRDKQEEVYESLMKPSLKTITQMELTGMPMNMGKVLEAEQTLEAILKEHMDALKVSPLVKAAEALINKAVWEKDFTDRRDKAKNPDKIKPKELSAFTETLNPNSGKQVARLLHDVLGLPIIETTPTKEPATDEKTLKNLKNHTKDKKVKDIIDHLLGINGVAKILGTFIPAFKEAQLGDDGIYYLFGSFNLGGTVSGRLSSSKPNLQQIPSGSTYAKLTKACFMGNADWLFCGADFNELEGRINTLLTQDPNKEKILIEGYDGHCFRAYSYWPNKLGHLPNTKEGVNSIKELYPDERQNSKAPSFALQYFGTYSTLMRNCGFTEEEAKQIEANYHKMYQVSDAWADNKLRQASAEGFATLAFGLRLRTPMLGSVVWGTTTVPKEAMAESRTAGNAISGQSYGLLNCRAANELMEKVRVSKYKYDIRICSQIHDACYFIIKNELGVIEWLNKHLIEAMAWQDLPELQHDKINLGAELGIFFPDWAHECVLKNGANKAEIRQLTNNHIEKLNKELLDG